MVAARGWVTEPSPLDGLSFSGAACRAAGVAAAAVSRVEGLVVERAGGGARQRVDELDGARLLVRSDARTAMLDQHFGGRGGTWLQDDDRLQALHPLQIGHADHRAVR